MAAYCSIAAASANVPGPFGQPLGWMPPMAAPVLPEHTPSQHPVTFPFPWPRDIPPPPGLEILGVTEPVLSPGQHIASPVCRTGNIPPVPEVPEPSAANLRFGIGSFGHPHFCNRPCVHISKSGVCPSGTECAYCHFPHRAVCKPDGQLRRRILDASDQELLATFLPFIFKKAAIEGLLPRVGGLLQLLQGEVYEPQSKAVLLGKFRPMRMSFKHLVESCMHRLPPHIRAEVNRIKSELPPPVVTLPGCSIQAIL
ncbi:unnamed protein product [Symbiodinium microadriaticum]|nr:unnamed protein product [Symbiodinium microadriaticum]